jgi:MFS family permease
VIRGNGVSVGHMSVRIRALLGTDGMPRVFWVLFAGQLVNRIGNMVATVMVFFLRAHGLDIADVGVVMAALGAGTLLSQPMAGVLADRFGARSLLIAGMVATAGSMGVLGIADGLPMTVLAAAALGLAGDLYRPAVSVLVTELVPAAARRRAFGLLYWAVNLGYPVAALSAGALAAHGYVLIAAVGVPRRPRAPRGQPVGLGTVVRDERLVAVVLLTTAAFTVYAQAWVGVPLAISDHGLTAATYGVVGAVNGVGICLVQPLAARWSARYPAMAVLGVAWLTIGVGMGATGLARTTTEFALTAVVWTIGEALTGGVAAAVVADLAPPGAQARYQAFYGWGWALAKFLGAAAGTAAYDLDPALLWYGCGVIGVLCAGAAFVLSPRLHA